MEKRTSLSLTPTEADSVRSERLRLRSPREREKRSPAQMAATVVLVVGAFVVMSGVAIAGLPVWIGAWVYELACGKP